MKRVHAPTLDVALRLHPLNNAGRRRGRQLGISIGGCLMKRTTGIAVLMGTAFSLAYLAARSNGRTTDQGLSQPSVAHDRAVGNAFFRTGPVTAHCVPHDAVQRAVSAAANAPRLRFPPIGFHRRARHRRGNLYSLASARHRKRLSSSRGSPMGWQRRGLQCWSPQSSRLRFGFGAK